VIDDENLQQNSLEVGTHLLKGFESLRDKYDVIGDVRGKVKLFNLLLIPLHRKSSLSSHRCPGYFDQTWDY
jgi:acetylornithine/succinyldiaminopimelate/putrescine aminotransferase